RHVLLVDDVMTSGATASAVAGHLKRAGADRVDVLIYARVAAVDAHTYVMPVPRQDDDGQD
ncbi:MAG: ComF family protein, partial [Sandaracinobacteroides sp.]